MSVSELISKGSLLFNNKGLETMYGMAHNRILMDDFEYEDGCEYQPQRIPTWDKPNGTVPQEYLNLINRFSFRNKAIVEYMNIHGCFDNIEVMLHHTLEGYENLWHGHYTDASRIHVLFYFGGEREEKHGGKLEVGRINQDKNIDFDRYHIVGDLNEVKLLNSYNCSHGNIVVINNSDPYILHQVTKVSGKLPRYTLMAALGYEVNFNKEKRKKSSHL